MAGATTEQAKVIVETALSFLLCQLPVFTEFVGKGIGGGGGRRCFVRFVAIAVLVAFRVVGVVVRLHVVRTGVVEQVFVEQKVG